MIDEGPTLIERYVSKLTKEKQHRDFEERRQKTKISCEEFVKSILSRNSSKRSELLAQLRKM